MHFLEGISIFFIAKIKKDGCYNEGIYRGQIFFLDS